MNALIKKLESLICLDESDKAALMSASSPIKTVAARTDLIQEGDSPTHIRLILSGMACRYKIMEDGTRQIVGFLLPGDICDMHVFVLKRMDHSIATLSKCDVVELSRKTVEALTQRPNLLRAFWLATLVDEAVLREWVVNVGGRTADKRLAHFLCEFLYRLRVVGLAHGNAFSLPLNQTELGQVMGISLVHMNRTMQALRSSGMIRVTHFDVEILDLPALEAFADFDHNYLHQV